MNDGDLELLAKRLDDYYSRGDVARDAQAGDTSVEPELPRKLRARWRRVRSIADQLDAIPRAGRTLPMVDAESGDVLVGGRLGRYEIRTVKGIGGFGVVYHAYDPHVRRDVAVKI